MIMNSFSFSDHRYLQQFKETLDSISIEVRPPNNMSVLSNDALVRKPYWVWLRQTCIDHLESSPQLITNFFGLKDVPAPDIFAWYCVVFCSFQFLWTSSSCFNHNIPTQWGIALQNFLSQLILDYGVDEKFITKKSAKALYTALVTPELFDSISEIDKHTSTTYSERVSKGHRETAQGCGCLLVLLAIFLLIAFFGN